MEYKEGTNMQRGRRIIFDKVSGQIIIDFGEAQGDILPFPAVNSLDFIDLPYGQDIDKFSRVKEYHIDTVTKTVVFDELLPVDETASEDFTDDTENQLLISEGVI
jgi:hypothetical protein